MRRLLRVIVLSALVAFAKASVSADETHARYFDQLRQRGLYSLAESEAVSRLAVDDLPLAARTEFSIELSRTLAEHAGYVSDDQRSEFWSRAIRTGQELLDREPANPRSVFLSAQIAAVHVVCGDWLRAEREVRPFDEPTLIQTRKACTKAIEELKLVEKLLSESNPRKPATGGPPSYELRHLLHVVRWQLGLTFRNRAELSAPDSEDRLKDLGEAEQNLRRLINTADEPIQTRAKLLLVVCLRLKNDRDRASEAMTVLEKLEPKPAEAVQDEITVERVRLLIDQKRVTDAAELILKTRAQRQRLTGEMWYLQARSLVGMREIALDKKQDALAERLAEQIATTIDRCEDQVGGYWSRRCRQYWDNIRTAQKYGSELDTLMQQARTDYTSGRIDASLAEYDLAEKLALKQGQNDIAMELGFTRASILFDAMKFDAAQIEFFRLSSDYANQERAPKAHLLGAYCLGRMYDDKRTQARRMAYVEALDRHLEKYPADTTANDARFLKAQYEEQRLQASIALPLYLQVEVTHPRALEAMAGAARCYEVILRRMIEKKLSTNEFEHEAVHRLSSYLIFNEDSSEDWNVTHAEIALRLASILLIGSDDQAKTNEAGSSVEISSGEPATENRYQLANRWLSRVAAFIERQDKGAAANENIDRLKLKLAPLRIVALTGSGSIGEAEKIFKALPSPPQELLSIVERLAQFAAASDRKQRAQIAALELRAAERLAPLRSQLSASENERLDRSMMMAYFYTGQVAEALPIARKQADLSAKDPGRQRDLATVLSQISHKEAQSLAKQCWHRVELLTKAGSAEWMTARIGVVTVYIQLNKFDEARKLIQVTKVLYPDIKPEALRTRVNELEAQLQTANSSSQ